MQCSEEKYAVMNYVGVQVRTTSLDLHTLTQCLFNVGPASLTLAQHQINTESQVYFVAYLYIPCLWFSLLLCPVCFCHIMNAYFVTCTSHLVSLSSYFHNIRVSKTFLFMILIIICFDKTWLLLIIPSFCTRGLINE